MYFLTLWDKKGAKEKAPAPGKFRKIEFEKESGVSESFYCCERKSKDHYIEHGFLNIANKLKNSRRSEILLYIHGFNNLPEDDIFPNAEKLQDLLDRHSRLKNKIEVMPLIWPCADRIGIVRDYFTDQDAADASGVTISRALHKFMEWQNHNNDNDGSPCLKRINILSHSMGNRVLLQGLVDFNKSGLVGSPQLFRNIFMVAADVENEILEREQPGHVIPAMSKNVIVYYANDDVAMPASKVSNLKHGILSKRLGLSGPERWKENMLPHNVFAVDCDAVNNKYGDPKGHTYFLDDGKGTKPGKVFSHIAGVLNSGRFSKKGDERNIIL